MKKTLVILVALGAMCFSAAVWADGGQPQKGGPGHGGMELMASPMMAVAPPESSTIQRLSDSVQLSEDQLTKLDAVLSKSKSTLGDLRKKSADATKALKTGLLASKYDAANVKALAAKSEKAEADVISESINTWSAVFNILSADQAAKLREMMSKREHGPAQGDRSGNGERPSGPPPSGDGSQGGGPAPGDGTQGGPGADGETPPMPGE